MARLWWQAVRRRPVVFGLLLLVSAVAVALSAAGPLLVRAVEQSATTVAFDEAGQAGRAVILSGELSAESTYEAAASTVALALDFRTPSGPGPWTDPTVSFVSDLGVTWRGRSADQTSRLVTVDQNCRIVVLTAGRCPAGPDEVLLPRSTADADGRALGDTIEFAGPRADMVRLRVVGRYDADASVAAPLVRPGGLRGELAAVTADPLVVSEAALQQQFGPLVRIVGRTEVRPGLGHDDTAVVAADLGELVTRLAAADLVLSLDSEVPALTERLADQLRAARIVILLSALQGLLLALFTLGIMAQQLARVRTAEWSVGRLQGVGRVRRWSAVYAETVVPLLLGVPVGLLLLWLVAAEVVRETLRAGTPVEPTRGPVLLTAAVAGVAAVLAVVVASGPRLRRPLADALQQQTEAARLTPVAAVLQAVVVVLALVTGYQLAAGGQLGAATTPLGLLAPGLFALAAAVVVVRGATAMVRRTTRHRARGLVGLVVGRRIARVPSAVQPSLVVAVGVALAVLATQVAVLSTRNQDLRADATVGAATVLHVTGAADATALQAAVRGADPDGRYAMAAQELDAGGSGGTSRIVAVDSARLVAVTTWRTRWSEIEDLPAALRGGSAPPMVLRGRTLSVTATTDRLDAGERPRGATSSAGPPVTLYATVQLPDGWTVLPLGQLVRGPAQRFAVPLPDGCGRGCRLVSLQVGAPKETSYVTHFTLSRLGTDELPPTVTDGWLQDPTRWRPAANELTADSVGQAIPVATEDGLSINALSSSGGPPQTIRSSDAVDPLPALLASGVDAPMVPGDPSLVYGTGLDGRAQILRPIGTAAVLPRSSGDGVLVDLAGVAGLSDPAQSQARSEVWLAPDAPADVVAALTQAGLTVTGRENVAPVREQFRTQPMTRGAVLAAAMGWAALALAVLALVAGRLIDAERRREDWAAMGRAGLPARQIRRLAATEIAGPAVLAVLLGAAAGIGALWLSASRLPLVDLATAGPPLDLTPDWPAAFALVAGSILAAAVVAAVGAWIETRWSRR